MVDLEREELVHLAVKGVGQAIARLVALELADVVRESAVAPHADLVREAERRVHLVVGEVFERLREAMGEFVAAALSPENLERLFAQSDAASYPRA